MYETIEEEMSNASSSPAHSLLSKKSSPTTCQPVFVVDSNTISIHSKPEESTWDDEHEITTLREYYALRDEAENVGSIYRLKDENPVLFVDFLDAISD